VAKRYYTCIVCGRKFPEGQGIIIEKAGIVLHFHSRRCATKFLKLLIERLDDSTARKVLGELIKELEEARRARAERARKVI
jgi:large subunit ribosomal protein L24e